MKRTFEEYLSGATHYLFPGSNHDAEDEQRRQFFAFCKANHLDQRFQELVANDPKWRAIAENNHVYFFENTVSNPRTFHKDLPSIHLLLTEGGKIPVVKVMVAYRSDYTKF